MRLGWTNHRTDGRVRRPDLSRRPMNARSLALPGSLVTSPGSGTMVGVTVYRDTAVVLRVTKLGEADRIITLLTRREGRVRAVAKGVRRTKSRFGSRLEPFSHVDLQLYTGRNLDIVTQAVTIDPFGPAIAADYGRYTAGTAIVETAERLTSEEKQPSLRLYLLLVSALRALAETERDTSLVLDAFLLRAMTLAGWAPALAECARCGTPGPHATFHVPSGGLLCVPCRSPGAARPAPAAVALMSALATGDWIGAEASPDGIRREASGLVAALLQWHMERGLRSLPMVERGGPGPIRRADVVKSNTSVEIESSREPFDGQPVARLPLDGQPRDGQPVARLPLDGQLRGGQPRGGLPGGGQVSGDEPFEGLDPAGGLTPPLRGVGG